MAAGIGGQHLDQLDAVRALHRLHAADRLATDALLGELLADPAQVVVVLHAARVEGAQVGEVDQPPHRMQVVDEAVGAGGVAQGHQVLEEGNLQLALCHQGIAVPAIVGLLVEEQRVVVAALASRLLLQGDRQRQVGGAETDAEHVVGRGDHLGHGANVLYRDGRGAGPRRRRRLTALPGAPRHPAVGVRSCVSPVICAVDSALSRETRQAFGNLE